MLDIGNQNLWLLIALLLSFLLLLRVRREERAAPPPRRMPVTPHELGHVIYEIARSGEVDEYRRLFLIGKETAIVFGNNQEADAYLSICGKLMPESLQLLKGQLKKAARYDRLEIDEHGFGTLWVIQVDQQPLSIPIGSVVQVGRIWRIKHPVVATPVTVAPEELIPMGEPTLEENRPYRFARLPIKDGPINVDADDLQYYVVVPRWWDAPHVEIISR